MNFQWQTISTFLLTLFFLGTQAQALPLVDVTLKASQWQANYSGDIGQDGESVTLDDLGFDEENATTLSLTVEHAVPFIPNFKLQSTDLSTTARGTLTSSQIFDLTGVNYTDENVTTKLDLSHTDITLFYSFLYFDLGMTGRIFDTESSIEGSRTAQKSSVAISGTIPMLYAGLNVDLPLTGLYVNANLNAVSYEGNGLQDLNAALGYKIGDVFPLVAELGYRKMDFDLKELDDIAGDFSIDGWYLSLGLAF